jgi:hypothetical protein
MTLGLFMYLQRLRGSYPCGTDLPCLCGFSRVECNLSQAQLQTAETHLM